ncbi:DUF4407 domain-containing protein [Echinicola marina]|uniref:DUF4407 domain-containing protein n=1 Tax=Echinicola marina TaxID=2859768 RepID=UPI001CF6C516|nr:DUF4407 domain-containing protein [Echinicola marina]UCS95588.1 DUF4407 domain-containing protein [Echinicola marina]
MEKLKDFLWFCSGGNMALLRKCPTESNKYIGIGGAVFFTGLLAALSGGYALFTVFEVWYWTVLFGLVWGLMIFNLDRFIVSGMRKRESFWSELRVAFPRLILAVLLAIVISKPLELKIFEKEINKKLEANKLKDLASSRENLMVVFPEVERLEKENDLLKQEIQEKAAFRDQKQKEYDSERFGEKTTGTTGIVGLGVNAEKKERQLDAAEDALIQVRERNWAKIDKNEVQINQILEDKEQVFLQQKSMIDQYDGMAARMDALATLTAESKAIAAANLFIVLLFVAIETAPVVVKLISNKGPYDLLLDKSESAVAVYVHEQKFKLQEASDMRLKYFSETSALENKLKIQDKNHRSVLISKTERDWLEEKLGKKPSKEDGVEVGEGLV